MKPRTAVRGCFFDFLDDPWKHPGHDQAAARFVRDGLLVIEDGLIRDFGPYADLADKYANVPTTHIRRRLILPGFIDGHIHFPQVRVVGAHGSQLLDWLKHWIFPEEEKYADRDYAQEAAEHFFTALLSAGTTTCQAFTTSSPVSSEVFFDQAARRQMRVIAGLTGIDRFAPPGTLISADDFYRQSKRLIEQYHRNGRNLYAITPRFAVGCSDEMMQRTAQLKREHPDCWINTHISESPREVYTARHEFPDCSDYTAVHEKHGLLGAKFTAGHGIWLSDDEFRRFARAGAAIAFCPMSNLFLGSGLFRLGRATDPEHRVRLAIGTDVGAGNSLSLTRVLDEAYKVGLCNNTMLDGSIDPREQDLAEAERNKLNSYRAFYLATLGGAHALYLDDVLGNFQPGKEADFVALDWMAGPRALAWRQSLTTTADAPDTIEDAAELLFGVMAVGDDRNVAETWIAGRRVYASETADPGPDATATQRPATIDAKN